MRLATSIVRAASLCLLTPVVSAQVRERWVDRHDAPPMQGDRATAVAIDAAGVAYVTGRSFNAQSGLPPPTQDIETVAYSPSGTVLWTARYDSPLAWDDQPFAIAVDAATNDVIVAGASSGDVGGTLVTRMTILRYSSAGTLLWARQRGNPVGPSAARSVVIDAAGAIFLTGADGTTSFRDLAIVKLDANGNDVWSTLVDGAGHSHDNGYDVALGPNGSVYACGWLRGVTTFIDFAVVKVDAGGAVQWARTWDGSANSADSALSLVVDAAGRAYAVGYVSSFGPTQESQDLQVVSWSTSGSSPWSWSWNSAADSLDGGVDIALDPFGRVVVAGYETVAGQGTNWLTTVLEGGGALVWQRTWNGPLNLDDFPQALTVDDQGTIVVVGQGRSFAGGSTDVDAVAIGWEASGVRRFEYGYTNPAALTAEKFVAVRGTATGAFVAVGDADLGAGTPADYLVASIERTALGFCFGDGSATACPCGNASAPIELAGCLHSLGTGGRLADAGATSLAADTLVLQGTSMTSSSALYFQGTSATGGGAGVVFGDGLRCVGGTIVRLGTQINVAGESQYPAIGDAPVSVRGGVTVPGERTYQVWYRNAAAFCTAATFNLTNALRVTWIP